MSRGGEGKDGGGGEGEEKRRDSIPHRPLSQSAPTGVEMKGEGK